MEIDFPYELSDQDAKGRLDLLTQYLHNKHGIVVTWIDAAKARFAGKYLVVKIDGELTLGSGHARFRGEDPGFLWRNRAKDYIQKKLAYYLDPKTETTALPTGEGELPHREGDRAIGVGGPQPLALEPAL